MFLVLLGGTFLISFVIVFCYHSWIRYFYPIFVLAIWVLMLFCIQALGGCGDDMMCNAWFELKDYVVVFS
ncbi:hypothetical protein IJU97_05750 [bacterium]|nr:hypothetical protein [bacterium]